MASEYGVVSFYGLGNLKESLGKLSVLKSRDVTLPTKVHIVKSMVFSVNMYEYKS